MLRKIIRHALSYYEFRHVNRLLSKKNKKSIDLSTSKRFLCLQMNAIGDAIMSQPAWTAIRRSFPDATIDLACSPHIAPLFENDPVIHRIHRWQRRQYIPGLFDDLEGVRQAVTKNNYDVIIDFTALPLTAVLCAQNDMPPSLGFRRAMRTSAGFLDLACAYEMTYPYSEANHLRTLMFCMVKSLLQIENPEVQPHIFIDDDSRQKAADLLSDRGLKEKTFIIVHPGAKWLPKIWPIPYWQTLIRKLRENMEVPVIILGGIADKEIIERIRDSKEILDVPHYISADINLSAALIQSSALCLCHDSAPMHMAAALGVKTVALFGPVLPSRSAPLESEGCRALHYDIFCSPCQLYYSRDRCRRGMNFCMYAISPNEVARIVKETINVISPIS